MCQEIGELRGCFYMSFQGFNEVSQLESSNVETPSGYFRPFLVSGFAVAVAVADVSAFGD